MHEERIAEMTKQGLSSRKIGEVLGISKNTVTSTRKRFGIKKPTENSTDFDRRVVEMRMRGYSCREISRELPVTYDHVRYACKQAGATSKAGYVARGEHRRVDLESNIYSRRNLNGRDLWPTIPYHIRIMERGHGQAVPQALMEEAICKYTND